MCFQYYKDTNSIEKELESYLNDKKIHEKLSLLKIEKDKQELFLDLLYDENITENTLKLLSRSFSNLKIKNLSSEEVHLEEISPKRMSEIIGNDLVYFNNDNISTIREQYGCEQRLKLYKMNIYYLKNNIADYELDENDFILLVNERNIDLRNRKKIAEAFLWKKIEGLARTDVYFAERIDEAILIHLLEIRTLKIIYKARIVANQAKFYSRKKKRIIL